MKIDLYTKGILTVIALSLVVMAFKDVDPISKAFADVHQQVGICHLNKLWCADVVPTRDGEALLVKIVE
jgi:hypothetical protein